LATGEQLREQRNQINAITEEVMKMDDNVTRAIKVVHLTYKAYLKFQWDFYLLICS